MTPLEALRELQGRKLVTVEDGEPCEAELTPAMSRAQIDQFEERLGAPLPAEIRELLSVASGVEVDFDQLAWHGDLPGQDAPGAFPCWIPVLEDGAGNSWNVDIDPKTGAWGRVYFVCHDPPVVVLQAASLAEFIIQFADDSCQPEREGSLYLVAERLVHKVWDTGGAPAEATQLRVSSDDVLRRAGSSVEEGLVCDLRQARMGDGFSLVCFGARTVVTRPGPEPVWVLTRPVGAKKWWRLWG
jgi:cell wall assembly regulator SMI1